MTKHQEHQYRWKNLLRLRFRPSNAPRTKWLWPDFIPERSLVFVVGDAGSFKSTFTLALCNAVSQGKPFLGRRTRRRRVLYLDNENPPGVLRGRDKEMNLGMETNRRLVLLSMYGKEPVPKVGSHALREIVRKSAAEGRKLLIVFDHWSTFLKPGEGGLSTGETTWILQEIKYLCALGATVVVLAHTLKNDKTRFYGAEDIRDKADAMHTFLLDEESGRKTIHVESFLKRHGEPQSFSVQPVIGEKRGKTRVTGFRLVKDIKKHERKMQIEKMCALIAETPNATQEELVALAAKMLGIGKNKTRGLLNRHAGEEWDVRQGPNQKKTYVLRERGRKLTR